METPTISSDSCGWWYVYLGDEELYRGGTRAGAEKFLKWYLTSRVE